MSEPVSLSQANIFFSCIEKAFFSFDRFFPHHSLVHILSGEMKVVQGDRNSTFGAGDTILLPGNQPAKLTKYPAGGQVYKSVSINFQQPVLQKYYSGHAPCEMKPEPPVIKLIGSHPLLDSLFGSLLPYFVLNEDLPEDLAAVKILEALSILRSLDKSVDSVLCRFSGPGKIDIADFMEKNYMFNLTMERFGYLTGRSLTTFKRDFQRAFGIPPRKWLTQKRLEQAHYLIFEQHQKPSDIYFQVGFENLSHFSFAFKKLFGYNPTGIRRVFGA